MSNRAIICTTDGPDKGCTIWDHDQHVDARHSLEQDPDGWGSEYGDAALDEIERLRALTTITDSMVERAARQIWGGVSLFRDPDTLPDPDSADVTDAGLARRYRRASRAALEAALNPPA